MGLSAAQVAAALDMHPHREGGFFRETYRSVIVTPTPAGSRSLCTSILYMLTATDPSRFHRLRFDEVWFFHAGSPVEVVLLDPLETVVLGPDAPQAVAPGGRWMAARIAGSGRRADRAATCTDGAATGSEPAEDGAEAAVAAWALVGCVVSPGFEYEDFEAGTREKLLASHPEAADYVRALAGS